MNEINEPKRRNRSAWLLTVVLLSVFVLYPLSLGPAFSFGYLPNAQGPFYRPVVFLCEKTGTDKALYQYKFWWYSIKGQSFPRHLADPYHYTESDK